MSKRRSLLQRQQQLCDVKDVVTAMRQLAFFETRKLGPRMENLYAMQQHIDTATRDFFIFLSSRPEG